MKSNLLVKVRIFEINIKIFNVMDVEIRRVEREACFGWFLAIGTMNVIEVMVEVGWRMDDHEKNTIVFYYGTWWSE